jgi:hypothetical protein
MTPQWRTLSPSGELLVEPTCSARCAIRDTRAPDQAASIGPLRSWAAFPNLSVRIARATAVELSLNDYRPFELPLAIPIGRLLLRGGQRDGFCHVIYGRSSGIANCGSRLCVSITAIRPW